MLASVELLLAYLESAESGFISQKEEHPQIAQDRSRSSRQKQESFAISHLSFRTALFHCKDAGGRSK
jgi:hypothetical protein